MKVYTSWRTISLLIIELILVLWLFFWYWLYTDQWWCTYDKSIINFQKNTQSCPANKNLDLLSDYISWSDLPNYLQNTSLSKQDVEKMFTQTALTDLDEDWIPTIIEMYHGDTDWDSIPDYLDPDDDNDLILTIDEIWLWNNDIIKKIIDWSVKNRSEYTKLISTIVFPNTDNDDQPNYLDPDDDNDWVKTRDELANNGDWLTDIDWDSIPNYLDPDDVVTQNDDSINLPETPQPPHRCVHPFWWYPLSHGDSIDAYEFNEVRYPQQCIPESRLCQYGALQWTFTFQSCSQIWDSCLWPDESSFTHNTVATYYQYDYIVWLPEDGEDICPREVRVCKDGSRATVDGQKKSFIFKHRVCEVVAP